MLPLKIVRIPSRPADEIRAYAEKQGSDRDQEASIFTAIEIIAVIGAIKNYIRKKVPALSAPPR